MPMSKAKTNGERRLSRLIYRSYLKNSLIPIFAIELVLLLLYFGITLYVSGKNQDYLLEEAVQGIQEIAAREVSIIDGKLAEVARLASLMQHDHERFFATDACQLPQAEPQFRQHENGAFYKSVDNGGATLYYSSSTEIGQAQLRKARCSESLDPLLRSIVSVSPVVTQAYLNTWDDMNRLFPFIGDAPQQYGSAIHMQDFNFYYLADAKHNPQRKPVWTGAYLDPAGQGWMVSVVVPVYRGDFLEGVSGLDVTIDAFLQNILDLRSPWNAAFAVVDEKGTILAMQPRAEQILKLNELTGHVYEAPVGATVEKPEEYNIFTHGDAQVREQTRSLFRAQARVGEIVVDKVRYLFSQEIVPATGWRLISLIERKDVLEPIMQLKQLSTRIGYLAVAGMVLFYIVFFFYMLRNSRAVSKSIADPIARLTDLSRDLGATLKAQSFEHVGIEEIDRLGSNFNAMAQELEARTQALIEAKLSAEAASRAKSTFLANMSHELRTPLNGIIGMTEMALRSARDPALRRRLEVVEQCSRHQLELIQDLLDISAIEADRLVLREEVFSLQSLVDSLQQVLGHTAEAKGMAIKVEAPESLLAQHLCGDVMRLGQVFSNLVGNAIKFSEQGDVRLRLEVHKQDAYRIELRVEIEDQGIGIPQDEHERLFNMFEQAEASTTRRYGGAGLGLAISRRLVEAMGGSIGLRSEPGKGSVFWFVVPLAKSAEVQLAHAADKEAELQLVEARLRELAEGRRILLVEDDEVNQIVAEDLLDQAGLSVTLAANGRQAVEAANGQVFDLILMDHQMPVMNGIDATRLIRERGLNVATPVLAMTASAYEEHRLACLEAGMDDFLSKPIEPLLFYRALLRWLSKGALDGAG